jgi:hypothetical protein
MSVASGVMPAMLVLETPEANLDAVFIARAGLLFSSFAPPQDNANTLIATCNLNQTDMIPAMFGASTLLKGDMPEHIEIARIPRNKRDERIVNLLAIAAENAALKKYRSEYDETLRDSLYPEAEVQDEPQIELA